MREVDREELTQDASRCIFSLPKHLVSLSGDFMRRVDPSKKGIIAEYTESCPDIIVDELRIQGIVKGSCHKH